MIEGSEKLGFALESVQAGCVLSECFRQDLGRHVSAELRVSGTVDFALSAGAEAFDDLEVQQEFTEQPAEILAHPAGS